jgi:hypothetical protein
LRLLPKAKFQIQNVGPSEGLREASELHGREPNPEKVSAPCCSRFTELCELDYKYQSIAKKNAAERDERKWYAVDWVLLEASVTRGTGGDYGEQWRIALTIREKLREYCMFPPF